MNYEHIPHSLLRTSALVAAGFSSVPIGRAQRQSVDRLNDREISVQQLDDDLARQEYMRDRAVVDAPDALLDGLKDQELLVQQAVKLDLERTLEVRLSIGSERRQILSQSSLDPVMVAVSESSDAEISAYYKADQALYSERRNYRFIHLAIDFPNVGDGLTTDIDAQIEAAVALENFAAWLNSAGLEYVLVHRTAAAEAMEQPILKALGKLQEDEFARISAADGLVLLLVRWSLDKAISEQNVFPAIRRLFADKRRIDSATTELEKLRERADIEIVLDPGANSDLAA